MTSAGLLAVGLAGCGTVEVAPQSQLPPPLIDQVPATVGVHYSEEFRRYEHKETRYQVDYDILLGPAHVAKLTRLLQAMFARVVEVGDPARPLEADPSIVMVLEPRFEDYAFLTPRDMVGEAYTVTIRYRLDVYDPRGQRVDGYVFTGYGREKSGALTGSGPLAIATQRAMRDAGAKLAVELPDQETVRLLLAGDEVGPKQSEEQARSEALGSFGDQATAQGNGAATSAAHGGTTGAETAGQAAAGTEEEATEEPVPASEAPPTEGDEPPPPAPDETESAAPGDELPAPARQGG